MEDVGLSGFYCSMRDWGVAFSWRDSGVEKLGLGV